MGSKILGQLVGEHLKFSLTEGRVRICHLSCFMTHLFLLSLEHSLCKLLFCSSFRPRALVNVILKEQGGIYRLAVIAIRNSKLCMSKKPEVLHGFSVHAEVIFSSHLLKG